MSKRDTTIDDLLSEQFGKHVLRCAIEDYYGSDTGYVGVDDDAEYDLSDAVNNIERVDTVEAAYVRDPSQTIDDETVGVSVDASLDATVTERTSRGSRHHPPEYESHTIECHAYAVWFPTDGLAPATRLEVEQIDANPLAPPDPEPRWRDV